MVDGWVNEGMDKWEQLAVNCAGSRARVHIRRRAPNASCSVVALHGFSGSAADFAPLWRMLERADCGYEWIVPDWMGHGKSDAPIDDRPYQLAAALDLIGQCIGMASNPQRLILLGYSMGGRIALHYLRRYPLAAALLIGSSPGLQLPGERARRRQQDAAWIRLLQSDGVEAFSAAWEAQPVIAYLQQLPAELRHQLAARRRGNRAAGLIGSLRNCGTGSLPSLWNKLDKLAGEPQRHQLHLAYGEQDHKFAAIAAAMQSRQPRFQLHSLPGCGHAPHLQNPAAMYGILKLMETGFAQH